MAPDTSPSPVPPPMRQRTTEALIESGTYPGGGGVTTSNTDDEDEDERDLEELGVPAENSPGLDAPITSDGARGGGQSEKDKEGDTPKTGMPERAKGIRERILHFTPSWYAATMGTGVISTLLNLLGTVWAPYSRPPYSDQVSTSAVSPSLPNRILRWPALVFLLLDIALFILFTAAFTARYVLFPQVLPLTLKHPQKSLFIGCMPMGLITIISAISQLGTTQFNLGIGFTLAATGLWFLATAISLIVGVGIPWTIMTLQAGNHKLRGTTAALLLPIVPPITAAAVGSTLVEALMDEYPTLAFTVWTISYMVLGIGLPLSLMIMVLYLQRLLLFQTPPREVVVSAFLPLGNHGQGGEALLHLGQAALRLFPRVQSSIPDNGIPELTLPVGQAIYGVGLIGSLMLWALGMWWAAIASLTFAREWRRKRVGFNMAMRVLYTVMTTAMIALWSVVALPTLVGFCNGTLLRAPCIADLPLDLNPLQNRKLARIPSV